MQSANAPGRQWDILGLQYIQLNEKQEAELEHKKVVAFDDNLEDHQEIQNPLISAPACRHHDG